MPASQTARAAQRRRPASASVPPGPRRVACRDRTCAANRPLMLRRQPGADQGARAWRLGPSAAAAAPTTPGATARPWSVTEPERGALPDGGRGRWVSADQRGTSPAAWPTTELARLVQRRRPDAAAFAQRGPGPTCCSNRWPAACPSSAPDVGGSAEVVTDARGGPAGGSCATPSTSPPRSRRCSHARPSRARVRELRQPVQLAGDQPGPAERCSATIAQRGPPCVTSSCSAMVLAALPFACRHTWAGVLLWTWISIMNPHRLTFGFTYNAPVAMLVAVGRYAAALHSPTQAAGDVGDGDDDAAHRVDARHLVLRHLPGPDPDDLSEGDEDPAMMLSSPALLHSKQHIELFILVLVGSLGSTG